MNHVLPALEHHTYSEDDVEEGGIKIHKIKIKSPLLDVGGFAKQGTGIKKPDFPAYLITVDNHVPSSKFNRLNHSIGVYC
jgi:hypothetical protein